MAYLGTNGCIEGQLSSTCLERFFKSNGLAVTEDSAQADVVVFYACGLTEQSERDSLMRVKRLKSDSKRSARFIVWGCLPKINPRRLSTVYDGPQVGPMDVSYFQELLQETGIRLDNMEVGGAEDLLVSRETSGRYEQNIDPLGDAFILLQQRWDALWKRVSKNTRFVIRVAKGCTGRCSYCSERCTFGKVKSRPIENVVSEFKSGLQQGYKRFSLMATDLGAYGRDMGCTLPDLLRRLIKIGGTRNHKIILNQVNPVYLSKYFPELQEIFRSGRIEELCSPVQSGSNRILRLMGREYSTEEWRGYMVRINREFPDIRLVTQFMVGYPTESDDDFDATLRLLERPLFLQNIDLYKFSERPTVRASYIEGRVSEATKDLRRKRLLKKYAKMYFLNSIIGSCKLAYPKTYELNA